MSKQYKRICLREAFLQDVLDNNIFCVCDQRWVGPATGATRAPPETKKYRMFLDDYERDAADANLHRHERVLGVDAVRVEHVRVAAHRREEHVLQYGRRQ